jgi:uncharacterized protein with von Willebrand factor type A (vWA) domain
MDPAPDPLQRLVLFGRLLRGRGLPVGTGRIMAFCRAAAVLDPLDREDLYWAGRATLISRRDHAAAFDAAFDAYFGSAEIEGAPAGAVAREAASPEGESTHGELPPDGIVAEVGVTAARWRSAADGDESEGEAALRLVASDVEVLRQRSFEALTPEERTRAAALIRRLEIRSPERRTRRLRAARRGRRFDMRRTLRRSLRTEGEPLHPAWRERRNSLRPLVLVLDVSGSMAPYSRALLQFAFAALAAGRKVEAFCFGTRLTRVTRTLRTRDPDRAFRDVGRAVEDWEGGTRIGESLKSLLDTWSQRGALRGAVVVLCSDGLERGDPDLLKSQMARLSRLAHKVVWVNPLKGSPRYEPLARGMAAALPHIDLFVPGHNLESLESLSAILAT